MIDLNLQYNSWYLSETSLHYFIHFARRKKLQGVPPNLSYIWASIAHDFFDKTFLSLMDKKFPVFFKTHPTFNPSSTQWGSMSIFRGSHFFRRKQRGPKSESVWCWLVSSPVHRLVLVTVHLSEQYPQPLLRLLRAEVIKLLRLLLASDDCLVVKARVVLPPGPVLLVPGAVGPVLLPLPPVTILLTWKSLLTTYKGEYFVGYLSTVPF